MILPAIKVTRQKKIPLFQEYFKACWGHHGPLGLVSASCLQTS
jgi:hypothetical protein